MLKHKQWEVGLKLRKKLIFSSINHRIRRFNVVNLVGKKESSSFRYSIADPRCREFQGHYISRARNWEDHRLAKFAIRNLSCNVWMEEIPADGRALLYWLIVFQKKRKKKSLWSLWPVLFVRTKMFFFRCQGKQNEVLTF